MLNGADANASCLGCSFPLSVFLLIFQGLAQDPTTRPIWFGIDFGYIKFVGTWDLTKFLGVLCSTDFVFCFFMVSFANNALSFVLFSFLFYEKHILEMLEMLITITAGRCALA